jgi:hypothetical protein
MKRFWKKNAEQNDRFEGEQPTAAELVKRYLLGQSDLVRIAGPEDGGCVCGDWVGAVVSVSGNDSAWPSLIDAVEDGVFHPTCRHRLEEYNPKEHEVEARFCSELAQHNFLARKSNDKTPTNTAASFDVAKQKEFEKLYQAARNAEKENALETALSKCEAALEILNHHNLYSEEQQIVEETLESRIRLLLKGFGTDSDRP